MKGGKEYGNGKEGISGKGKGMGKDGLVHVVGKDGYY